MNENVLESFIDTCNEMMVPVQEGLFRKIKEKFTKKKPDNKSSEAFRALKNNEEFQNNVVANFDKIKTEIIDSIQKIQKKYPAISKWMVCSFDGTVYNFDILVFHEYDMYDDITGGENDSTKQAEYTKLQKLSTKYIDDCIAALGSIARKYKMISFYNTGTSIETNVYLWMLVKQ